MNATDKPKTYSEMLQRVQQARKSATVKDQADTEALQSIKDPAEKGKKETPSHPDGDSAAKTRIPAKPSNTSKNDARVPGENLNPAGVGESAAKVPSTQDGNAREDAATSPTTDINKIANEVSARVGGILSRLEGLQNKKASASGDKPKAVPSKKAGASAQSGKEPEAKEKVAAEEKPAAEAKDTTEQQIDFNDVDFALKIAHVVTQAEGGIEWVQAQARKQAGIAAAQEIANDAALYQEILEKQAAEQAELEELAYLDQLIFEDNMQKLAAEYEELTKNASEDDLKKIQQRVNVHTKIASAFDYDFEKVGYEDGAMDAAALEDALAAEEDLPEEASDLSVEEVIQVIEDAVMAGEIPEEVGMQVIEELVSQEQAGGDPGMEEITEEDLEAAMMAEKMASEVVKD